MDNKNKSNDISSMEAYDCPFFDIHFSPAFARMFEENKEGARSVALIADKSGLGNDFWGFMF